MKKFNIKEWQDKYLNEGIVNERDVQGFIELIVDAVEFGDVPEIKHLGHDELRGMGEEFGSNPKAGKEIGAIVTKALVKLGNKFGTDTEVEDCKPYLQAANKEIKKMFGVDKTIDINKIERVFTK